MSADYINSQANLSFCVSDYAQSADHRTCPCIVRAPNRVSCAVPNISARRDGFEKKISPDHYESQTLAWSANNECPLVSKHVREAVAPTKAGIRPITITGDHPVIAADTATGIMCLRTLSPYPEIFPGINRKSGKSGRKNKLPRSRAG